jgi:exopolysaccharide biosynthesis protein
MKKAVCLLLCMAVLLPGAGMAGSLPLDFSPAPAPDAAAYLSDREYSDPTLHVTIEDITQDHVARVTVADPSQLRTGLSCEPGGSTKAKPSTIALSQNAVLAINGDSYLYRKKGLIIRQGQVIRKSTSTDLDLLVIDTAGDFHAVRKPTKADIADVLARTDVAQCFAFGPVLVMDGQAQPVYNDYGFAPQDKSPRTAIGQTGPLSYVFVVVDGRLDSSRGVTHKQLAAFMVSLGCTVAFNLDGGGSSTMLLGGAVINSLSQKSERDVSDIIYVATGVSGS